LGGDNAGGVVQVLPGVKHVVDPSWVGTLKDGPEHGLPVTTPPVAEGRATFPQLNDPAPKGTGQTQQYGSITHEELGAPSHPCGVQV